MKIFLIVLVLGLASSQNLTLIMVQELYRHGAREAYYDEWDGALYKQDRGELTPTGMRQHYVLGRQIRDQYITKLQFLPQNFNHSLIRIRCTDVNRTLQSAYSHLSGMYPGGTGPGVGATQGTPYVLPPYKNLTVQTDPAWGSAAVPGNLQPVPIHTVAPQDETLLRAFDTDVCPNQVLWRKENLNSPEYKRIVSLFNETFVQFSNSANVTLNNVNFSRISGFMDVYKTDEWAGRPLPTLYTTNSTYNQNLNYIFSLNFYLSMYKTQIQRQTAASALMNQIVTNFKNQYSTASNVDKDIKWMMYSAHDTTVAAVLVFLNYTNYQCMEQVVLANGNYTGPLCVTQWPPYASNMIFELYQNDKNAHFIKIQYLGDYLPLDPETKSEIMNFDTWASQVVSYATLSEDGQDSDKSYQDLCGYPQADEVEYIPKWVTIVIILLSVVVVALISVLIFIMRRFSIAKKKSLYLSMQEKGKTATDTSA